MFKKYFNDFLMYDMEQDYYYSIEKYSRTKNGFNADYYYKIKINHIEELFDDGSDENDMKFYDILISRFYDYLIEYHNNEEEEKGYLIENIASDICEYTDMCE